MSDEPIKAWIVIIAPVDQGNVESFDPVSGEIVVNGTNGGRFTGEYLNNVFLDEEKALRVFLGEALAEAKYARDRLAEIKAEKAARLTKGAKR